jgi:hypothetical protein
MLRDERRSPAEHCWLPWDAEVRRGQGGAHQRPRPGQGGEVMAHQRPLVGGHEVAVVVEPLGRGGAGEIDGQHASGDEARVEAMGHQVGRRRCGDALRCVERSLVVHQIEIVLGIGELLVGSCRGWGTRTGRQWQADSNPQGKNPVGPHFRSSCAAMARTPGAETGAASGLIVGPLAKASQSLTARIGGRVMASTWVTSRIDGARKPP